MADTTNARPTDADFDALSERLTDPSTPAPVAADVSQNEDAARRGREMMLQQYGSEDALETAMKRPGRRRLGERPTGASPTVRGRIPEAEFAAFKELELVTGKGQSELVREAVHNLLVQHKLVG